MRNNGPKVKLKQAEAQPSAWKMEGTHMSHAVVLQLTPPLRLSPHR